MAPYLRGDILEVGAGHGTFSARLANYGKVVASDPSEKCVIRLRQKLAGNAAVEVEQGDDVTAAPNRSFDAIVLINVLEHIEDDVAAVQRLSARLKPGGHLLVFVPAFQRLYSPFDAAVGHHRRYERGLLLASAYRAGMDVIEARYVNSLGALAWWLMAAKLERVPTRGWSVQFYDRMLVPWLRKLEGMKAPPIGQSLLLVAKPPSTDSYA